MPDPSIVGLGAGAVAAYLAKDGVAKLLGPTADYLGSGLKDFTQKRLENISAIFQSAEAKLGSEIEKDGRVPPKVLKEVIDAGSYTEDALAIEYFGGVLASSRTNVGRDDRGACISQIVGRMSSYQLRAHYIIYNSIVCLFSGKNFSIGYNDRHRMRIFIPSDSFARAMDFTVEETSQDESIMRHVIFGMESAQLLDPEMYYGPKARYYVGSENISGSGLLCEPSALGTDVFLWAHGRGTERLEHIFSDAFKPLIDREIVKLAEARPGPRTPTTE